MQNKVYIKIFSDSSNVAKYLINKRVDFVNLKEEKNYVTLCILKRDLDKIKYFKYETLKDFSITYILCLIKRKIYYFFLLLFAISLFFIFSNIIIEVNINSSNASLVNKLYKSLDKYNIKRLTFKKSFKEINDIKDKLLNDYKESIEWLEIENIGMNYNIKLEERKIKNIENNSSVCDIISKEDGIITKIISSKGNVVVKNNQFVKEGDVLISSHIFLNEEEKQSVCAAGEVYAQKWYSIVLDFPLNYQEKVYTNKVRNNFMIEIDNNDYKIFKSRLKNYDEDKEEILSILNKKLYLIKEYEYKLVNKEYNEEALNKRIDELVVEKLNLSLNEKERIINKKVLKKEVNNSRIKIELFTIVEKQIGKQITY